MPKQLFNLQPHNSSFVKQVVFTVILGTVVMLVPPSWVVDYFLRITIVGFFIWSVAEDYLAATRKARGEIPIATPVELASYVTRHKTVIAQYDTLVEFMISRENHKLSAELAYKIDTYKTDLRAFVVNLDATRPEEHLESNLTEAMHALTAKAQEILNDLKLVGYVIPTHKGPSSHMLH